MPPFAPHARAGRAPGPAAFARRAAVALPAAALALAAALAAGPVRAERADRDKPITVEADRMEYDDLKQVNTFSGRVVLAKGTILIRADRLVIRQDAEGWQYATAEGRPASFRQKRDGVDEHVEGFGQRIDYDGKAETVRLQTGAMMRRLAGERVTDEIHGASILYESRSEFFSVDGGPRAATPANPSERVRVVIQPRNTGAAAPSAPAPLKPAESLAPAPQDGRR